MSRRCDQCGFEYGYDVTHICGLEGLGSGVVVVTTPSPQAVGVPSLTGSSLLVVQLAAAEARIATLEAALESALCHPGRRQGNDSGDGECYCTTCATVRAALAQPVGAR